MNKPKNQFAALNETDRRQILDLCSKNGYEDVADLLAKPRAEGGLDMITSAPALCRFYTTTHSDSTHTLLAQYAAAANIRHEQDSNAFLGAIRANVEARVLESLRKGKALADMDKEFRFLKVVENIYLADAQWRTANPKAARAAYQRHVDHCANAPEIDFVTVEELKANPDKLQSLGLQSDLEQEIFQSRERQKREAEDHRQLLASFTRFNSHASNPSIPMRTVASPSPSNLAHAAQSASKTPVIPHIPHNSTNSVAAPGSTSHNHLQPVTEPAKKPVPRVSSTPKVGRNDPCPCGSGRKYKKCCYR